MTTRIRHIPVARASRSRPGFTLLELIIASIMLAILVTASYMSISQTIKARDRSQARSDAFTRASSVADLIATDAASALRDADLTDCRIAITREGKAGQGQDGLMLFSHLTRTVRPDANQAEGEEAEVQFRLVVGDKPGTMTLWRRTDPVVDDVPDGGGVATALVDGVKGVNIQANNGTDWVDDWDSDNDGLPHAVRISVTGVDDTGKESIVVRRTVALDRVPLPSEKEAMEDAATAAADAAANATANAASNATNANNTNANGNTGGNLQGRGIGNGNGRGNGNGNGNQFGGGNGTGRGNGGNGNGRGNGGNGNGNGNGGNGQGGGPQSRPIQGNPGTGGPRGGGATGGGGGGGGRR